MEWGSWYGAMAGGLGECLWMGRSKVKGLWLGRMGRSRVVFGRIIGLLGSFKRKNTVEN